MRPKASLLLARAKVPAFLVTDLVNVRYLTGAVVSSGCVLVHKNRYHFFTSPLYLEEVKHILLPGVALHDAVELPRMLKKIRRCAIESDKMTISEDALWKKKYKSTKCVQTTGIVEEFRRTKSPIELKNIRKAIAITHEILDKIPALLKTGIQERDLAWQLECMAREKGADEMAFPSIVGFGKHTSSPHHHPTSTKLKKGDIVQIDMGVVVHGYRSDFSRVYFTDRPTTEQKKVFAALVRCMLVASKAVKAGVSIHALDRLARKTLQQEGVDSDFPHALGHGVGLEIHEGVVLSERRADQRLLRHEVVTIEPGVYMPGKWGMRLEDTVIVAS